MSRIALLAVVGLALAITGKAKADIAPPLPPAKDSVAVKIEVDEKAKGPRLVLPNGVFTPARRRPQPLPLPNAPPQAAIEQDGGDAVAGNENPARPRSGILIAGIAFALSLACGGLWLRRRGGKSSVRGLVLLVAAGASVATGAVVWANAAPPLPPAKKTEAFPSAFEGKASVEFVIGQEPVRLILDKESYEKLKKGELKEVPK